MRTFTNMEDALNETVREVFSRGITVFDETMQGKLVDREEYEQKELLNYQYKVTDFKKAKQMYELAQEIFGHEHLRKEIGDAWAHEMIHEANNPGEWWLDSDYLVDYWGDFGLDGDGLMSYTYSKRINDETVNNNSQLENVKKKLRDNPESRGAFISIWDRELDLPQSLNSRRVPCTIGYQFINRQNQLDVIIFQRSCDLINFFSHDMHKAYKLLDHLAADLQMNTGSLIHNITSLHAYKKDVPQQYQW